MSKKKKDDRASWVRQSSLLATVPFLLAVPPIAGLLIGQYLDKRFDTNPIFTVILLVLGFIAGGREVAEVVKKANQHDKNDS